MRSLFHNRMMHFLLYGLKIFSIGICFGTLVTCILYNVPKYLGLYGQSGNLKSTMNLETVASKTIMNSGLAENSQFVVSSSKPTMYTFYVDISGVIDYSGKSEVPKLLNVWQERWENAGWETQILEMKDAEAHLSFSVLRDLLESANIGLYERVRFYRWAAMAHATPKEGGWMSDMDVLPLHIKQEEGVKIPNDGMFTFHDDLIPDLMSGSKVEWNRLLQLFIDTLPTHHGYFLDTFLLRTVFRTRGNDIAKVVTSNEQVSLAFQFTIIGDVDCSKYGENVKAVHFSLESHEDSFLGGWLETDIRKIFSRTHDLPMDQIVLNFTDSKGYRVRQNPETRLYTHVSYVSDVQVEINNEKIGTAFEVFDRHRSHLAISFMDRISNQCRTFK